MKKQNPLTKIIILLILSVLGTSFAFTEEKCEVTNIDIKQLPDRSLVDITLTRPSAYNHSRFPNKVVLDILDSHYSYSRSTLILEEGPVSGIASGQYRPGRIEPPTVRTVVYLRDEEAVYEVRSNEEHIVLSVTSQPGSAVPVRAGKPEALSLPKEIRESEPAPEVASSPAEREKLETPSEKPGEEKRKVTGIKVEHLAYKSLVYISVTKPSKYKHSKLYNMLVLDIPDSHYAYTQPTLLLEKGPISSIRSGQFKDTPAVVRIVVHLREQEVE